MGRATHPRRLRAGSAPPWRFALLRGGPELHGVTILFHHTVMDGWGTTLVLRRWADHYNAILRGLAPPARGASYLQFIEETQKYHARPALPATATTG